VDRAGVYCRRDASGVGRGDSWGTDRPPGVRGNGRQSRAVLNRPLRGLRRESPGTHPSASRWAILSRPLRGLDPGSSPSVSVTDFVLTCSEKRSSAGARRRRILCGPGGSLLSPRRLRRRKGRFVRNRPSAWRARERPTEEGVCRGAVLNRPLRGLRRERPRTYPSAARWAILSRPLRGL
jgi:hypothetical protein